MSNTRHFAKGKIKPNNNYFRIDKYIYFVIMNECVYGKEEAKKYEDCRCRFHIHSQFHNVHGQWQLGSNEI